VQREAGCCFTRGGVAQLAGATESCLRVNDPDQLTDTKQWFRAALNSDHDLMRRLSDTSQEVAMQIQQATASLGTGVQSGVTPLVGAVDAREERQRITGTICIAVRYVRLMALADDIRALNVGDGGRVFVADMPKQGPAFQRGVRPGDELVRIRINHGMSRIPDASTQWLQQLALEPGMAHQFCEAFFMGFAGQFPAEVNISGMLECSPELSGNLGNITGYSPFSVPDYAAFRPSCHSLLLASKAEPQRPHTASTDLDHEGSPWQLMEVKQPQARRLLAAAILLPMPACEQPVTISDGPWII